MRSLKFTFVILALASLLVVALYASADAQRSGRHGGTYYSGHHGGYQGHHYRSGGGYYGRGYYGYSRPYYGHRYYARPYYGWYGDSYYYRYYRPYYSSYSYSYPYYGCYPSYCYLPFPFFLPPLSFFFHF